MKKIIMAMLAALSIGPSARATEVQASGPIKVATWNIQVGSESPPFENGWKERKEALIPAIKAAAPDIFCTQEGRLEQLQWIEKHFPAYTRIGVGRDDGKSGGEFCAIYYRPARFELLKSGTFWLSDTPDSAKTTWDGPYKRICTHALFKDKINATTFAVLSTHFPLIPAVQPKAAKLVASKIKALYEGQPTFLCGDFNCQPGSEPWHEFESLGLESADAKHQKTYHLNGMATLCLDAIFKSEDIRIVDLKLLNGKFKSHYPSDHFGLMVNAFVPEINR
jgi:endonuclease/exonuclease/phosphatase family metal-dependent hydrolase